jgi:cobalt-zinc-cadmium efflux system membrane fusion protein
VWVQLSVYQKDLPRLRLGERVAVTSDAYPGRTLAGIVSYIGDVVDETTRAVKVRAVIQNSDRALKPGAYVRGIIATGGRTTGITVPRDAVQSMDGKPVVFVQGQKEGEFEKREVETGETADGRIVITSGLKPGERVVVKGAFTVKSQAMKGELVGD